LTEHFLFLEADFLCMGLSSQMSSWPGAFFTPRSCSITH
jgi:hypothetical protein